MASSFRDQLTSYVQQAGLPMSRVARQANIPRQTLFNWLNGTHPRWHDHLADDLQRLGAALGLSPEQIVNMLVLAGCMPALPEVQSQEEAMSTYTMPKGWFAAGSNPMGYEMGIDPEVQFQGVPCSTLKAKEQSVYGFGTLMQNFAATRYINQRLRLSAVVRAVDVEQWAGLWMRLDGTRGEVVGFDNMQGRPITGNLRLGPP
jgi:hypothetical protein